MHRTELISARAKSAPNGGIMLEVTNKLQPTRRTGERPRKRSIGELEAQKKVAIGETVLALARAKEIAWPQPKVRAHSTAPG